MASPGQGMAGEPEAVSEDEQAELTDKARRRVLDERIRRRQATAAEIEHELSFIEARARYLRRELGRLGRRV